MPRFSLRELFLLMTICALLVPYLFSHAFTTQRIDLSWDTVRAMVAKVDPATRILSGSGGSEQVELTCLVPVESSDVFFSKLHDEISKQIDDSGWVNRGTGSSTSNGRVTRFSYDLVNGTSRCSVVGILLDKKKGKDWFNNKDVDEVRFIVLSPHVR